MKGELYGDQIVVLRDLDPTDGGGDGEPLLDVNEQLIAVGFDPANLHPTEVDTLFPIFFELVEGEEDDYEIPSVLQPYVQEVELERANVARAPSSVMEKALDAAVEKLLTADVVDTDAAGRLIYSTDDGASFLTIDAPLENLALYQALMTAGADNTWTSVTEAWPEFFQELENWDPSALLGAAWSKEGEITLDAMLYENTTLGVNVVTGGDALVIDYFSFNENGTEAYDYVRSERYADTWIRWIEVEDGAPVYKEATVMEAVFGNEEWGVEDDDGVLEANEDVYLALAPNPDEDPLDPYDDFLFVYESAANDGVNDFAQAADDSRAVIEFMHEFMAVEIAPPEVPEAIA
ncbi:hypothetical protein [Tropicimonas sediminicola]|nr:hypothetical protein [Tropicimonas sediminicola]